MNRIMIIGQPGGGKSTLARKLGDKTGLPVVYVDLIHWMPGWIERPKAEKIAMALEIQSQPKWIFEGGLSQTHEDRLERAEMLIVLNIGFMLRVWRVFVRTIRHYGQSRPDLPENCPERFDFEFWEWIWDTRNSHRAYALRLAARAKEMGKDVVILSSRREVDRFLKEFPPLSI